jgi:hypothetical protein
MQEDPELLSGRAVVDHISEEFGVVEVERILALHAVNGEEFGERKDGSQSHLECVVYF